MAPVDETTVPAEAVRSGPIDTVCLSFVIGRVIGRQRGAVKQGTDEVASGCTGGIINTTDRRKVRRSVMPATSVVDTVRSFRTIADLVEHLGGIPLKRIRLRPIPGTATAKDAFEIERNEGALCEVIDGVLVEKAMGYYESRVAIILAYFIQAYLEGHDLGILTGADGPLFVDPGQMRYPDLAFFSWDKFPNRVLPREPILDHVPDLSVEVLSASNTPREMERKRLENFSGGARLVWEIDPDDRWIRVYTAADQFDTLHDGDQLTGGSVLPDFTMSVTALFDRAGRRG